MPAFISALRLGAGLVLFSLGLGLAGCGGRDVDVTVLRLGHGLNTNHPVHKGMERLAEEMQARTNGQVRILIYPNEQLGSERESLELLQLGALDMTKASSAVLEAFQEEYKVFGLPFLFNSGDHMWQVLEGPIGRQILESGRDRNLLGLCYYDAGARSFYTRQTPIREPDDLRGLNIRVQQSEMAMKMVRALGGSPTPVSWGELYSALQQGIVDGAENNPPSFYTSNHYQASRYFSRNEHLRLPDVLLIQSRRFDKLSAAHQQAFREALAASVTFQREIWQLAETEAIQAVKAAGVEVIEFDDLSPFQEKVQPILLEFKGSIVGDLAERIRLFDSTAHHE
jgi:tripartite ATP-independent transporter DctP family solute receptor